MSEKFKGFPLETLRFLHDLSINNHRDWFQAHKEIYEAQVRTPALDFIVAMEQPLKKISPHFRAIAKKSGGSMMRPYRDTRFAKDKTPYKTNVGIQFRHERGKDVHAPGVYLHVDTEQAFLGVGIWRPDSPGLSKIRKKIVKDSERWLKIKKAAGFKKNFEIQGDRLIRTPKGYDADHPMIDELRWKDHIAVCQIDFDILMSPDLVKHVVRRIKTGSKYLEFLCESMKLKY
jgi:uncharacterized protein (TIGR02453 family)